MIWDDGRTRLPVGTRVKLKHFGPQFSGRLGEVKLRNERLYRVEHLIELDSGAQILVTDAQSQLTVIEE